MSERYDDLRNLDHIETWRRAPVPCVTRCRLRSDRSRQWLRRVYLVAPAGMEGIEIDVENAVPMVVHTQGVSSAGDWTEAMAAMARLR